jgi:tetratricopeptide (TPR) repeat protein
MTKMTETKWLYLAHIPMETTAQEVPKQPTPWHLAEILGIGFIALFIVAMLFPEAWWGMHFLAFLPNSVTLLLLVLTVALVFGSRWAHRLPSYNFELRSIQRTIAFAFIAGVTGVIFYNSTIFSPIYGDSPKFSDVLLDTERPASFHWDLLMSMDIFQGKVGERTVLNGAVLFSKALGVDNIAGFRILTALLGAAYAFLALIFSYNYFKTMHWRVIFAVLFIASPTVLNFCGHLEIYAPTALVFSAFFMTVLLYFRTSKGKFIVLAIPLLLIALKLHISAWALTLALITMFIHWLSRKKPELIKKLFNWKVATVAAILPAIILVCVVYFGVFEDHNDPRFLFKELNVLERMFLPLFSPEAPLDRYNMLSFNHIFDYFNEMMLWSSAGMMLLFTFLFGYRKQINWNTPEVVVMGVLLFAYTLFFFMINPLLAMPIDWDLLAIPAPLFILFLATIAQQFDTKEFGKKILGPVLAISLMGLMIIPVNASQSMLSHRIEAIGMHVMKTYWITGAGDLSIALALETDENKLVQRFNDIIDRLEPHAVLGNDVEYAELVRRFATYYRKGKRNPQAALSLHLTAEKYDAKSGINALGLMETYFLLGDMQSSLQYAKKMLELNYPHRKKAFYVCIHVALEAEKYQEALQFTTAYLQEFPGDERAQYVHENLRLGNDLPQLKKVFTGG